MKKISMILSATLAVFALASCKQDIIINPADGETVVGSIPFELAASADEFATRTALDVDTWNVSWESATQRPDAKADSIYAVTSDAEWGKPYADDKPAATVAAFGYNGSSFSTESTISDGEHTFYFVYSNNSQKSYHRADGTTNQLAGTQSMDAAAPTAGLRAYDALAGKVSATTPTTVTDVTMFHLYTLMKVTLKNQTGADMTVTSFSMSVDDGAFLSGISNVDFSGTTPVATYSKNGSNVVTVNIANGEIKAGANLDVYFVILPQTNYSGGVTFQVATASDTYTKTNTVSALSFAAGSHNSASYTLKNADAKVTEPVGKTGWYRVEDASWLKAGDKVAIVAPDEALAMSTTQNTNNRGAVSIVKGTDGDYQTFSSSSSDFQIFVVEAGTEEKSFAFKCSNGAQAGKYIYASSSEKNYLLSKDTKDANASFSVSVHSGIATVVAQGENTRNVMRFNPNTTNDNPLFSCYGSNSTTGTLVSIYKQYGEAASYTLTVDPNTVNGTIDADPKGSVQAGTNVTLTATPADGYVLDAWSVKDEAGADAATVVNNTFSMPAKNVTVSATFKSATAVDFTNIAELKAKITSETAVELKGTLSGVTVTYVNGRNAFLRDATGSILYFKEGHELKVGQTFTGSITVSALVYNGNYREITDIGTAKFEGEGAAVTPETVTLADLVGNYDTYENAYVKITDLAVSSVSKKNINVSSGELSYVVFHNPGNVTDAIAAAGDVITATGTVTKYNTTEELKVWASADIEKQGSTPPVVEPTIEASDITGVAAAGVLDATTTVTISNADGYAIADPLVDGTVVSEASLDGSTLTYSVSENTTTSARDGWIKISLTKTGSTPVEQTITVSQLAASGGGDPAVYTLNFTSIANKVGDYTSSWDQTCGGFTWTLTNFNNNNAGWTTLDGGIVKCGRKNVESTGLITTKTAIPEAIATVTLDIDKFNEEKCTSIKLFVDTASDFSSSSCQTISGAVSTGTQQFVVPTPTANCYYKLEFVCESASKNGVVWVKSVVFTEGSGSGNENPL